MFDLGGMKEKIEAIKKSLDTIYVEAEAGDGAVRVTVTANKNLKNISLDKAIVDPEDIEQLEDLITVATNRAMEKAEVKAAEEMKKGYDSIMPGLSNMPGMDGLF